MTLADNRPQFRADAAFRAELRDRLALVQRWDWGKAILRIILLTFVLVSSVVALIRPPATSAALPGSAAAVVTAGLSQSDAILVVVFHGSEHCRFCDQMQKFCAAELPPVGDPVAATSDVERPVLYRAINFDTSEGQVCREAYGLFTASVVLFDIRDGQIQRWQLLESAWVLTEDQAGFQKALRAAVESLRRPPP